MARFTHSLRFTRLTVALLLGLAITVSAQVQVQSSPAPLSSKLPNLLKNSFRPPRTSGPGAPDNTLPGGTRTGGECMASKPSDTMPGTPVSLVPASKIGTTTAAYPTIYWYMPRSTAGAVEFNLWDESDNQPIYSVRYSLDKYTVKTNNDTESLVAGAPGVMSLTVPPSAGAPLQVGKEYFWQLRVVCDATDPTDHGDNNRIEGRIKRVQLDPTLTVRIQQASLEERVALYQKAQVWYEAVGALVELQRQRPDDQNLAVAWDNLLNSGGI